MKHKISWTNATWNVCTGCTPVGKGCEACYARKMHNRLRRMGQPKYQHPFSEVVCHPEVLDEPYRWKKPRMVFVNSMSDLFHKDVPSEFIRDTFDTMLRFDKHTYQLLTKRPERMMEFVKSMMLGTLPKHIWFGFSASTQKELDEGLPYLLKTPTAVRFVSLEPLLEEINLPDVDSAAAHSMGEKSMLFPMNLIDWTICGGESKGAHPGRPCKLEWVRNIVEQCQAAGVACFVKQIHMNGKLIKDVNRFPPDLQIQDYPKEVK